MLLVTQSITGGGDFQTYSSCDIAGIYLIQLLTLVGVHLQDTADTLLLALGCIQYVGTGIHGTRIYAEECQLTNERIGHDLECQSCERLVIGGVLLNLRCLPYQHP